jgi:hypothetical protein
MSSLASRFTLTSVLVIFMLAAGGSPQTARLLAQSAAPLLGDWENVDPNSGGIVKVVIQGSASNLTIRAYGNCQPTSCDWGPTSGVSYGFTVSDSQGTGFTASWDFGFSVKLLTGWLNLSDGTLNVASWTTFKDGSGRSSYYAVDVFNRSVTASASPDSVQIRSIEYLSNAPLIFLVRLRYTLGSADEADLAGC